ncbi:peptidase M16 [Clostridium gelidum]|uniref:Peptidase M16 n=1 Tax=Clostridium gelidum TaxID=704125 RepID=A0ABN6IWL1_9CLOT|nr:pitrilysin family protein [Clostridium gelidum]BCZ45293.1 peptidase M16 [Clostridium gelidum]
MEEYILENKLKLIYKHTESELTSICISIDAGAGVENEKYGIAHATEHMVYKGTKNRTEKEINEELSNLFGFNNAMTNFPYVIYYGTLLEEDLKKGVDLLSDIVINPSFNEVGFKEELDVIKEELKEWDEELEQYCEDKLFLNCFDNRRIKYPIIGTEESLDSITLNDIKKFYSEYYFPENTSVVIISSAKFDQVKDIVEGYFDKWKNRIIYNKYKKEIEYEVLKACTFDNKRDGTNTCKIEIVCPIDKLNEKEMRALRIFNQYFGEGVNSILYDTLRTNKGLVYDVITKIAHENYIKLYKITFSTAKENVNKIIYLIKECIRNLELLEQALNKKEIEQLIKNFKLKRLFREEQSIILAKELATYDCMFGDYKIYVNEIEGLDLLTNEIIFKVGIRVLKNLTIQIID